MVVDDVAVVGAVVVAIMYHVVGVEDVVYDDVIAAVAVVDDIILAEDVE